MCISLTGRVLEYLWTSKPRTHSYGFAQVYLRDNVRLHLFAGDIGEEASIPEQVPIRHNHRYDFASMVLGGIVVDRPCDWITKMDGHGPISAEIQRSHFGNVEPWSMHEVRPAHHGIAETRAYEGVREISHGEIWDAGRVQQVEQGWVVERKPRIMRAGESYIMHHDQFHETGWIGETVSLFQRYNVREEWSKLLVPPGYQPQHSLTKQPDLNFLKRRFVQAVSKLGEREQEIIAEHLP